MQSNNRGKYFALPTFDSIFLSSLQYFRVRLHFVLKFETCFIQSIFEFTFWFFTLIWYFQAGGIEHAKALGPKVPDAHKVVVIGDTIGDVMGLQMMFLVKEKV